MRSTVDSDTPGKVTHSLRAQWLEILLLGAEFVGLVQLGARPPTSVRREPFADAGVLADVEERLP
jgi:hypothetical protein